MIVAISGSRAIEDETARIALGWVLPRLMTRLIVSYGMRDTQYHDLGWIHGGAEGVDSIAHDLLVNGRYSVPEKRIRVVRPNYAKHGQQAPWKRNTALIKNANFLAAVWDGQSRGTADMIAKATTKGIPVVVEVVS